MAFIQSPPSLGNQYHLDSLIQEYKTRQFAENRLLEQEFSYLGELGGNELYLASLADRKNEPTLTQWDPWGERIDRIELSPLWRRAKILSAQHGLVATAYEGKEGFRSRLCQFIKNYLVQPSLDVYSCPLAMTDGAARTLLDSKNQSLIDLAIPHLTSRDPHTFWTSGQWMTERTGGSDVGLSETIAQPTDSQSALEPWSLYGTKWFTSATTSEIALTLARPHEGKEGGQGLALFFVNVLDDIKNMKKGIYVNRLKDKLGTRKVPTAELTLDGAMAIPVQGLENGVKNITPMLNVTRTWNAMAAVWGMRRAIALAVDYSKKRHAFGSTLHKKPLHIDTLATMVAEFNGAFLLAFKTAELLGKIETSDATADDKAIFRVLAPITKLTTGKQAVAIASEALESFGGAGYVEDTGMPRLLADAQVLPIWEGTTNVLSLDVLRAMKKSPESVTKLLEYAEKALSRKLPVELTIATEQIKHSTARIKEWLISMRQQPLELEMHARRLSLSLGRLMELALLVEHAEWVDKNNLNPRRAIAAANRFASLGVIRLGVFELSDSKALIED